MELIRLKSTDYDEWLHVLNSAFSENGIPANFETALPKMCVRDDYHMGMHLGIKEDGKLVSLLGIYPLPVKIGTYDLLFSTVGNVATLKEYEGRGYMKVLMEAAMNELKRMGADASRLGGARQRYNRYGYELSGTQYNFTITSANTKYCADKTSSLEFVKLLPEDTDKLRFIHELRKGEKMYVERSADGTFFGDYSTLCAWRNTPYVVCDAKKPVGYISASKERRTIDDICAINSETFKNIIFDWQKKEGSDVTFSLSPLKHEEIRYFSSVAASLSKSSPCNFKIINFDKVADALIKLKSEYAKLPDGEAIIEIRDWGNLSISNKNGIAKCEKTTKPAEFSLDKLTATRYLFGVYEPECVAEVNEFLSAILPLPLSWNTLDRV